MKNQSNTNIQESFLQLVRLGIGASNDALISKDVNWEQMKVLADEQGLSAIVLDGLNTDGANLSDGMPLEMKLEWIGEVLQGESMYSLQQEVSADIAKLYHNNAIRMYVLKGAVVSECYPKPNHRVSVDVDCFLTKEFKGSSSLKVQDEEWDAWSLGNDLIRAKGFAVNTDFYKNSSFDISGVLVENHQFLTPFRGNDKLSALENVLQSYLRQNKELDIIEGTNLYRPPVMVTALFLIEHAYSHFLHEGLTWRMVLDWMMFRKKHKKEICWMDFNALIDEFGFRKFYDSFSRLGQYLIGEIKDSGFTFQDERMLADVWAPLDVHETVRGVKGKLALAGNTWRARWKYKYFTDMNWMQALWIQIKGFLFEKNPSLN